jgi:putative PIN family toxin of toxin-antitoxin system
MNIVIDTDVMVAALGSSKGASRVVLHSLLAQEYKMLMSTTLFVEYEMVLTRPENLKRFGLKTNEVVIILDTLAAICQPVSFDYRWRPEANDADDDLVLETAINGYASAILSFNLKDLEQAAARFNIPVIRPGDFLERTRR